MAKNTVIVNTFTNGILGPDVPMLGPVKDGGFIVANTAPGCWGPMLTPEIRGGHEVTQPVLVEGAEVGDAIAIKIISVEVSSQGTSSGNDHVFGDRCLGDPFVAGKCPYGIIRTNGKTQCFQGFQRLSLPIQFLFQP